MIVQCTAKEQSKINSVAEAASCIAGHFISRLILGTRMPIAVFTGACARVPRGADKSSAFPVSYFRICSTTKRLLLGWVKEVRTTKS
jgi:hypothetical protein